MFPLSARQIATNPPRSTSVMPRTALVLIRQGKYVLSMENKIKICEN